MPKYNPPQSLGITETVLHSSIKWGFCTAELLDYFV